MTAKEFLQQAYYAQQEVEFKLEEIARLECLATRTTATLKSTPSGSNAATSKIETAVAKMEDQRTRLAEEVTELLKITEEVADAINKVQNYAEKQILKYRYLRFYDWKQISILMKMSSRQLYRLHSQALENFGSRCH